ncbi:MAG: NAD(+) diphosphatase [Methanosphaera sp.]|nr:NAD(+) diphosphatase [Methanosphaera sp.]
MIEESLYKYYDIDFKSDYPTGDEAYYFIFNNNRELYLNNDDDLTTLTKDDIEEFDFEFKFYIGKFKGKDCYVANVDLESDKFRTLFEVYESSHTIYLMATRAVLVRDWYISHRYCGRCATENELDNKDMMMKCPECGQVHYSRISPAIIVAITKDNKLLMARHSYHAHIRYALIAGFVEAGESIEEAVHREVMEEVGIKIKNLKYIKSQSWPFPNSLMLAFTADYDSGQIEVDGDEILKAKWFEKDEIIPYESDISISAWLVENFIRNH